MRDWFKSGSPWIWLTAGAVAAAVLAVAGVLALTALRGLGHFWPKPVAETTFTERDGRVIGLIGELRDRANRAELVVAVDTPSIHRLGALAELARGEVLVIDHHNSSMLFGTANFVDHEADSTTLLIADVLDAWGIDIGLDAASWLYAGLTIDTGSFRWASPRAVRSGSRCSSQPVTVSKLDVSRNGAASAPVSL